MHETRGGCWASQGGAAQSEELRRRLPPGHVLRVMIAEHEAILGLLERLEDAEAAVRACADTPGDLEELREVCELAHAIVGAEPHHQREEQVLFPRLEERGIHGPTSVMRAEHEELRALKHRLVVLAESGTRVSVSDAFPAFEDELRSVVRTLCIMLRQHIAKENEVLYPMAARAVADPAAWERMKADCDAIGYCAFTPAGDLGTVARA